MATFAVSGVVKQGFELVRDAFVENFERHHELGQGKDKITVRQLLAHQAGLHILDEQPTMELVADLDRLAAVLARAYSVFAIVGITKHNGGFAATTDGQPTRNGCSFGKKVFQDP